jgi:hypothetical protein
LYLRDEFYDELQDGIFKFHEVIKRSKLKGEYLEEIFVNAGIAAGYKTAWVPSGHNSIWDVKLNDITIQIKSGTFKTHIINHKRTQCLYMSGQRLTRFDTYWDAVEYLENNKPDYIICFPETELNVYHMYCLDPSYLNYTEYNWVFSDSDKEFRVKDAPFKASINESMSAQLWQSIPLEYFSLLETFNRYEY